MCGNVENDIGGDLAETVRTNQAERAERHTDALQAEAGVPRVRVRGCRLLLPDRM